MMSTSSNRITNHQKQWRCFFGLVHVRTATCCIGLWHLMLNLLAITLLAVIVKNPAMMQTMNNHDNNYDDELIPTPVSSKADFVPSSSVETSNTYNTRDHSLNYQDFDMGGLVCLCMIAITLMLVYGTIKGRASHLLPFFFLQLCDFAITTLTAAGYLCYLRTIHNLIEQSNRLPWKDELIQIDPRTLGVLVLFAFIFMVMLKAYCIGIVWRCYKYLTIRQNASMLQYIMPENVNQERSFNSLLPDYEEALTMKITPPPSYQVAMQQQVTPTVSSPEHANSESETEPPSYNTIAASGTVVSANNSPTNQGSVDEAEEIQVVPATAGAVGGNNQPASTAQQPQRDQ